MWTRNKTRKIALAGMLLAISAICAYLAGVLPTSRLAMLALASFVTGIVIKETGLRVGVAFTFATLFTGFLVMSGRPIFIIFATLFAPYGIVRGIIHKLDGKIIKLDQKIVQIILKFVYFNLVFFLFLNLFETLVFNFDGLKRLMGLTNENPLLYLIIFVGANIAFFIYDHLYTLVMRFYMERISVIVNREGKL